MATVAGTKRLLDISGNNISTAVSLEAEGTLVDSSGDSGIPGQILSSTGSGVNWINNATGDITGVTAGTGMTGGGTSGTVTLNVIGGTGITANANDIAIDATVVTLTGSQALTNKTGSNSQWTNDEGYTTNTGDITSVTAGTGLTGGGTSGAVTLNVASNTYTPYNDIRSLGVEAFTNGTNPNITTAQVMAEIESDGGFDSYSSVFKTSWSYAGNYNLTDAGSFTETAGSSWITWTDNSSDTTRGTITTLAIAPNTGGSAGGVFIYNDQGSGYDPGWREVWTSRTDGPGSGLDADLLDSQQGTYYLDYNNFTNTPTIPQGDITAVTAGDGLTGGGTSGSVTLNVDSTVVRTSGDISISGVKTFNRTLNVLSGDTNLIDIRTTSNGTGAKISFTDQGSSPTQFGNITYYHSDSASYGSGNAFVLSGTEANMTILADGKLMFKEGIYIKPATGTGAGIRKDVNWDTAYNYSQTGHIPISGSASMNTASGIKSFYSNDVMNTATGDQSTFEIYQDTVGADAFMQFHIGGDYAAYFGLAGDTNDFEVGGWSMGATKYRVLHQGNSIEAWNLNQELTTTSSPTFNTITANGSIYVNWNDTSSDIYMQDSDQGSRRIHCNSDYIGFLKSDNNWGFRVHDNGNTITAGTASFPTDIYVGDQIIHDGDTNTYLQFHAADQFRVVTGGVERLEVNNTEVTVAGNLRVVGAFKDSSGDSGIPGQILSSTGSGTTWINNQTGDITGVTAGNGLTGGGTSGSVNLAANYAATSSNLIQAATQVTSISDKTYTPYILVSESNPGVTNGAVNKIRLENINLDRFGNTLAVNKTIKLSRSTLTNSINSSPIYVDNTSTGYGEAYNYDSDVSSYYGSIHMAFRYNGTVRGSISQSGTSNVAFNTSHSDERLKKNIEVWDENILEKFEKIKPKKFNFLDDKVDEKKTKGYIAQEMVESFPEAYPTDFSEENYYSYNPSGMVVYLTKAIKELIEKNKQLENRIKTLENN